MTEPSIRDYRERYQTFSSLPTTGRSRDEVLAEMSEMAALEESRWEDGYASGSVYNGDPDHIAFLNQVYAQSGVMPIVYTNSSYNNDEVTASLAFGEAPSGAPLPIKAWFPTGTQRGLEFRH